MLRDQLQIALVSQLLGVRRLVPNQTQTGDATSFLVDRDNWLRLAQVAQVVDQPAQLCRAFNVAAEEDEGAGVDAAKQPGRFRVELFPGPAGEDHLTRRIALHRLRT